MNAITSVNFVRREIKRVNKIIDRKILRGEPYQSDSRYHRDLVRMLHMVSRHGWFERTFLSFSLF